MINKTSSELIERATKLAHVLDKIASSSSETLERVLQKEASVGERGEDGTPT